MADLLKYDGHCIVGIPNIASFNARVFGEKWFHLDCPRHLYLYSPRTISKLMNKAGLKITRIIYDKTAWGLFNSLRYCLGDDSVPLSRRRKVRGGSTTKRCLLPLTIILAILRQSDIMVVYARKM